MISKVNNNIDLSQCSRAFFAITSIYLLFHLFFSDHVLYISDDSHTYINFQFDSSELILSQFRTPAYPLFIEFINKFAQGYDFVPHIQLAISCLAIWIFFYSLLQFGISPLYGFCFTLPLFFEHHLQWRDNLLTESLSISSCIVSMALYLLAYKRDKLIWWLLMSIMIFISVLIRPANLFLVPLLPTLAFIFSYILPGKKAYLRKSVLVCILAVVGPLLTYCLIRLILVGHFGLVSFGGMNAIGLAGTMINEEAIDSLPNQDKALAKIIFEKRKELDLQPIQERKNLSLKEKYNIFENEYNINVWQIAVPTLRNDVSKFNPSALDVAANQELSRLSKKIFINQYDTYLSYIGLSIIASSKRIISHHFYYVWFAIFLPSLVLVFKRGEPMRYLQDWEKVVSVVILCILYYVYSTLLLVSVEVPKHRYLMTNFVLMPGALLAWAYLFYKQNSSSL